MRPYTRMISLGEGLGLRRTVRIVLSKVFFEQESFVIHVYL